MFFVFLFICFSTLVFGSISNFVYVRTSGGTLLSTFPTIIQTITGHSLDWYRYESGQVRLTEPLHKKSIHNVIIEPKGSLKYPNPNSPLLIWEQNTLLFKCILNPTHNTLTLISNEFIFEEEIDMRTTGNNKGVIVLIPQKEEQIVSFSSVYLNNNFQMFSNQKFTFTEKIDLSNPEDVKKLIRKVGE